MKIIKGAHADNSATIVTFSGGWICAKIEDDPSDIWLHPAQIKIETTEERNLFFCRPESPTHFGKYKIRDDGTLFKVKGA